MAYDNVTPPPLPEYDSGTYGFYLLVFNYEKDAEDWYMVHLIYSAWRFHYEEGVGVTNTAATFTRTYSEGSWTEEMQNTETLALNPGLGGVVYQRIYTNANIFNGDEIWLAENTVTPVETEKFPIKDFLNGFIMALCGRAVQWPKREPIGFIYGGKPYTSSNEFTNIGLRRGGVVTYHSGAVLPKLPKCDLPYMMIEYAEVDGLVDGGRLAKLICSSEPIKHKALIPALFRYEVLGDVQYWGYVNNDAVWEWSFGMDEPYPTLNEWVKIGEGHFDERTDVPQQVYSCSIAWANHDVVVADDSEIFTPGSVRLHKSDPIPVYGIVDYIDGIPIYE